MYLAPAFPGQLSNLQTKVGDLQGKIYFMFENCIYLDQISLQLGISFWGARAKMCMSAYGHDLEPCTLVWGNPNRLSTFNPTQALIRSVALDLSPIPPYARF